MTTASGVLIVIPVLLEPRRFVFSEAYQFLFDEYYRPGSATTVEDLQAIVHRHVESSPRSVLPFSREEEFAVSLWAVR